MSESYVSAALTDRGAVRGNNEDEVYANDELGIYFVVDGMGGQTAGEEAARIAKGVLMQCLERPVGTPDQRVREAIALANNGIFEAAELNADWRGMACVLTVALIEDNRVTVGHVGDSRLYKATRDDLVKITKDHSPVGEQEDNHKLTEEQAMNHPQRNEVYRDVGSAKHGPYDPNFVETYDMTLEPGTGILICSDGLTDVLPKMAILSIIQHYAGDPGKVADELVRRQKAAMGKDNVSVVYVERPAVARSAVARTQQQAPDLANGRPIGQPYDLRFGDRAPNWHRAAAYDLDPAERFSTTHLLLAVVFGVAMGVIATKLVEIYNSEPPPKPIKTDDAVLIVNAADPSAQHTIAAAMLAAKRNQTVKLTAGTIYEETVNLKDHVNLDGAGAILRPKMSLGIIAHAGDTVKISNLRIEAGRTLLKGIEASDGYLTIRNIDISGAREYAIRAAGAGTLSLVASSLHDNSGGAVLLGGTVIADLNDNSFTNNGGAKPVPDIRIDSLRAKIDLTGNHFSNAGPAILAPPGSPVTKYLNANFFNGQRPGPTSEIKFESRGR